MKSRNERLWDAYCVFMRDDAPQWMSAMQTAESAVNYFDAHCPREDAEPIRAESDRKVSEEISDPVRAAAVAFVRAQQDLNGNEDRSNDFRQALDALVAAVKRPDAVAAERGKTEQGCVAQRTEQRSSNPLVAGSIPAAPTKAWLDGDMEAWAASANREVANWRALVGELKDACEAQNNRFARENNWAAQENKRSARAVSALIAALDKPEGEPAVEEPLNITMLWGYPLRSWTAMQSAGRKAWNLDDPALIAERILDCCKGCSANANELATLRKERDELQSALEATRKELAEARERLNVVVIETSIAAKHVHEILGASPIELDVEAARRVVAERESLQASLNATLKTLADVKSQLAARDDLRDAAVEFAEAYFIDCETMPETFRRWADREDSRDKRIGRSGIRYSAARDAAQKAGA